MTTLRQAAQQALKALETERDIYREHDEDGAPEYILDAITSIQAALAQPVQRKPLTDDVLVPLEVLEAAANSLDSFCGSLGWGDADLQNMDNLFAVIEQHKAAHGIKEKT